MRAIGFGDRRAWLRRLAIGLAVLTAALSTQSVAAAPPRTIIIDGANDFAADEAASGTNGSTWYFTWDATNFYFAITATEVGTPSSTEWVLLYVDTDPRVDPLSGAGTLMGVRFNTQQPNLPFRADYLLAVKTDGSLILPMAYGADWAIAPFAGISYQRNGTYLEAQLPRASLGNPSAVNVVGAMINEATSFESTYAVTPNMNAIGVDPDFTAFHTFTFSPTTAYSLRYLPPLNQSSSGTEVTNTAKNGRVIPVKVEIFLNSVEQTDAQLTAGPPTIKVSPLTSCAGSSGPEVAYADAGNSSAGTDAFRWSAEAPGFWVYNLDTRALGLTVGACYRLDVHLGGTQISNAQYAILEVVR